MSDSRKLPPFERSFAALTLSANEAVIAPMRPKLREFGITEPQWRVMRVINDHNSTDATGVAEGGNLHPASVSRILKELEQRKLIVRESDPNDRRRTTVVLSPDGRAIVKVISRHVIRLMQEYSDRFGARRLENLINELRALSMTIKGVQ